MSDTEDSQPESAPAPEPTIDPMNAEPDPGEIPLETINANDEPDPGPITLEEEFRGGHHLGGIKRDE